MKRLHIHTDVKTQEKAIRLYGVLGAAPIKINSRYVKRLLEDPTVNFALSTRAAKQGVDHLGIQVDDAHELEGMRKRLKPSRDASLRRRRNGVFRCMANCRGA